MARRSITAALWGGAVFALSGTCAAQTGGIELQAGEVAPDASPDSPAASRQGVASPEDLQARINRLQAEVTALQQSLATLQASVIKTTPSWKGAPLFEDKDAGWSFKPRGRLQFDVGFVGNPEDAVVTRNLGFNARARRIRLGVEGTIPGGFGYKAEVDFANGSVGFGDAIVTYAAKGTPFTFTLGNHETHNGLEQISSSRFLSFVERAAFDDAFINTRRIGVSAGYADKSGTFRANIGLFAAHSIDGSFANDGWIAAARATYSPVVGGNQLHFGASYQHRNFQSNNGDTVNGQSGGEPSSNQRVRYRARPFTQLTDQRFVDTDFFAAKSDNIVGFEFAGMFKSLHFAAEGQYIVANAYDRGDSIDGGDPLDRFGTSSVFVPSGDPSFWGAYAELGYFFTGETRGYRNGLWDRTKVLNPFSKGGWGALQLNGRVDYLDLDSQRLKDGCTNNFITGACTGTAGLGRGGTQLGLLGSLVWIPEDYLRFTLQYSHAAITGGPFAATVKPTSSKPIDERKYDVGTVAARAQVDF